jgi:hypothetical protein
MTQRISRGDFVVTARRAARLGHQALTWLVALVLFLGILPPMPAPASADGLAQAIAADICHSQADDTQGGQADSGHDCCHHCCLSPLPLLPTATLAVAPAIRFVADYVPAPPSSAPPAPDVRTHPARAPPFLVA